jgi:hypothetical protein
MLFANPFIEGPPLDAELPSCFRNRVFSHRRIHSLYILSTKTFAREPLGREQKIIAIRLWKWLPTPITRARGANRKTSDGISARLALKRE